MKSLLILASIVGVVFAYASANEKSATETEFKPTVGIDHKSYIDKALAHLIEQRPEIDPTNLSCMGLDYRFNFAESTQQVCGPNGCEIKQVAPFKERLSVSFQVLNSGVEMEEDGQKVTKYEGIHVVFPSARNQDWSIGPSTITEYN